jgi:hypothetical protein
MNEEPNPYEPPRADPLPVASGMGDSDSGSLWRVMDGKLQVRHMASLPDICIDGAPEGEPGRRYSQAMHRVPRGITGLVWVVVGVVALSGWLPLNNLTIFILCVANALPVAVSEPRVLFFRSHSAMRAARSSSSWWLALFVAAVASAFFFPSGSGFYEAGGTFNVIALLGGPLLLLRSIMDSGFGQARKREDGWFELKGIAPAAIARLEELQKRMPPSMKAPRSNKSS